MVLTGKKLCTCSNLVKGRTDGHTEKEAIHLLYLGKGQDRLPHWEANYAYVKSW